MLIRIPSCHYFIKLMKKLKIIVSISFVVIGLLSSGNSEAKGLPLSTWKSIMNTEIYKVRNNKQLQQDVMFLMWDWQTYVGKYCGGRPLAQKSKLWDAINRQ